MELSRSEVRRQLKLALNASFLNLQFLIVVILATLVLVSSFAVLSQKLAYREAMITLQKNEQLKEKLHVQWTQLLLEHSTLASPARVEKIAQDNLNMHLPDIKDIQLVKEP